MKRFGIFLLLVFGVAFANCNKSSGNSSASLAALLVGSAGSGSTITVSGNVNYEFPVYSNTYGLQLNNPTLVTKNARQIQVQILSAADGSVLGSTNTDNSGNYSISVTAAVSQIKVRAVARVMANSLNSAYKSSDTTNNILVNILDNTSGGATYAMTSSAVSVASSVIQNLTAQVSTSAAGPFAILGTEMDAYDLLQSAESGMTFTKLNIYWSVNNSNSSTTSSCPISSGCIGTSYYSSSSKSLYILGKADVDTDQYDSGVIAHEFGHYVEDTLYRSDSIGGSHSSGDKLDPRVAFGEGWGNAFSSMVRKDPIYYDTYSTYNAATAVQMDMESAGTAATNPGVYSETSVQNILWDLYDSTNTGETAYDNLSYGFQPIFSVLRNHQKNTMALTTLISFINGMKLAHTADTSAIDTLVAHESVGTVSDDYTVSSGDSAGVRSAAYISQGTTTGTSGTLDFNPGAGGTGQNKYTATKYYRITATGTRNIAVAPPAGCDADIYLYEKGVIKSSSNAGAEGVTETISNYSLVGDEILDVRLYSVSSSTTTGTCTNYSLSIQ